MVGYQLGNTITEHGSVSRGVCIVDNENNLIRVDERTKIQIKNGEIGFFEQEDKWISLDAKTTVSMNIWGFTPGFFDFLEKGFVKFLTESITVPKSEYFIPTEVSNLINNKIASVKVLESDAKWFGVTYQEDRIFVVNSLRQLVQQNIYPNNLWL